MPPPEHVRVGLERMGIHIGQESAAVTALMEQGIKPLTSAKRLVEKHGERLCLDWIEALPYCKYDDPARYLVAALEKGYTLPDALFADRQDKQRRAQQQAEEKCRAEIGRRTANAARNEKEEAERRWEALPPARKAQIEAQARAVIAAKPMGKRLLEGPLGQEQLRARCLELATQDNESTMQKAA